MKSGPEQLETIAMRRRMPPTGGREVWLDRPGGVRVRAMFWQAQLSSAPATTKRGTVVLLHGWREFIEKYFETIADLLDRGYAVATMDWRGQGLSTRPLADRHKGYARSFDANIADVGALVSRARSDGLPGPYFLMGHSFGGNCALRVLEATPAAFERAVILAPMTGIYFALLSESLARKLVAGAVHLGLETRYAPFQSGYAEPVRVVKAQVLTSDLDRMEDEIIACRRNPDLALGGVTYGWLNAAFAAIDKLRAPGFAEAIETPVLFALAGDERVVDNAATRRLIARMPRAEVLEIPGARHEILKERDIYRAQFWNAFDNFMGQDFQEPGRG